LAKNEGAHHSHIALQVKPGRFLFVHAVYSFAHSYLTGKSRWIMNYSHRYHAGNFADVLKHAILLACLDHLRQKPAPFLALDTHAGVGGYDLQSLEAGKTLEWMDGVGRLAGRDGLPPFWSRYVQFVLAVQATLDLTRYPGSPEICARSLRPQDRMIACEAHVGIAMELRHALSPWANASVDHGDGYSLLEQLSPPAKRRGLILIDPPFEAVDEFDRLARTIKRAYERWREGIFVIWYPVKGARAVKRFEAELIGAAIPAMLVAGLTVNAESTGLGSCAVAVVNPPWSLYATLQNALPWAAPVLAQGPGAAFRLEWLSPPV
jgi:23S rRNA (adenine2030-N6)-methyltransferase